MIDSLLQPLLLPDLWQQQAIGVLRNGQDVVVHAPTGAGKTFVFELYQPSIRGQAIFTVPTRALANDKFAEWRAKGWDVGIATGDLALRLDAKVIVATLETQKARFLQRKGPKLLVVDEFQMLGDPVRGVNYELALALAPPETQLLLLSGSVANPQGVVDWLRRIGRDAVLIAHDKRPVPLQEVNLLSLPDRAAQSIRDRLPRWVANALRAGLGPILIFAPRRHAAEELAKTLAQALPPDQPLGLTNAQATLAGSRLARFLHSRVAFHHSGLSYAQRAGLIEPLAKHGQLRVVVATMGLAAGINFSMRSVLVSGTTYKAGNMEREVQPDELLQMYGRAGRRGLDDAGFALVTPHPPRLLDARPRQLRRAAPLDWPTLIEVMRSAGERSETPFAAASELNRRLFTPAEIPLGTEHSLATGPMPCNLWVDMERARFARRGILEILNSRDEWEPRSANSEQRALSEVMIRKGEAWRPALSDAATLQGIGVGNICKVTNDLSPRYGRELSIGTRQGDGSLILSPLLKRTFNLKRVNLDALETKVLSRLPGLSGGARIVALFPRDEQLVARVDFGFVQIAVWIDRYGVALRDPPEREVLPAPCRGCPELPWCSSVEIAFSPAYAWRHLGLIDPGGNPAPRGILFSFFHRGEGLAIAAALEDPEYPIDDLLFDLANLRAGPRFAGDDSPFGGRLGGLCQQTFERGDYPGYLEMGVPPEYGAGASEIVREIVEHSTPWSKFVTESLRHGDIERALIEWRSLLRHIVWAADYESSRWCELKSAAARFIESTESPILAELPLLTAAQRQRNNR